MAWRRPDTEDIRGGDPADNAEITRQVLAGAGGPRRDIVLLNAAAALHAAGAVDGIGEGIKLAADVIDRGRATKVLEDLIAFTREAA